MVNSSTQFVTVGRTMSRVTISGKAKIGTMDGDFPRDQIYGLFKFFFNKSGTLKCSSGLECWGEIRGDLQKKKKKVITYLAACSGHFQAENCTTRAAKQVLTFSFFFYLFWRSHSPCYTAPTYRDSRLHTRDQTVLFD